MRKFLQKKEKGYYSGLDFDNLYKQKKKKKLRFSLRREKHFSDTEVVIRKKEVEKKENGSYYLFKQIHYKRKNEKLYLFNEVKIYKDYFGSHDCRDNRKINNLKKILKIYEHVNTNEQNKLYELIKFFSFTKDGFRSNTLRRKLWLLLLGFNTNFSKEENYNEHPIYILCKKERQKYRRGKVSPDDDLLKGVKLKWSQKKRKSPSGFGCEIKGKRKGNDQRGKKEREQKNNKYGIKTKYVTKETAGITKNEKYRNEEKQNYLFSSADFNNEGKREIGPLKSFKDSTYSYITFSSSSSSFSSVNSVSSSASSPSFSSSSSSSSSISSSTSSLMYEPSDFFFKTTPSFSSSATSSSSISLFSNCVCSSFNEGNGNEFISIKRESIRSPVDALFSEPLLETPSNRNKLSNRTVMKVRLCENTFNSRSCHEPNTRSGSVFSIQERGEVMETKTDVKKMKRSKRNYVRKKRKQNKEAKNEEMYTDIKGKIKRRVQKKGHNIASSLLNLNGKKKQNKRFLIKLLKIIYTNLIEVDIYVVDFILRKYETEKRKKRRIFSYLKYNVKNNFYMHSNLTKWIMDSILLEDRERNQVKKDVKRSVNTWNVHKNNNIYEIKKKYQYLLKNIICSILYKHSRKIFYAQGVHDVCLVFITLYFHDFFLKYKKYVVLEYFIRKYVLGKICNGIFEQETLNEIKKEECMYAPELAEEHVPKEIYVDTTRHENKETIYTRDGKKNEEKYFSTPFGNISKPKHCVFEDIISKMFSVETKYIEKLCLLKNINFEKYLEYKKKKKKREYIVYLLCERFMLFYMIDYLTLSLNISIKNTFKGIGLLLKYIDEEVYDVFRLLHKEQELENEREEMTEKGKAKNRNNKETGRRGNLGMYRKSSKGNLQLNGNEFFFCLSWVLTYYSHVFTEFDKLARIFDTLLANSGIFIIYFTSVIILNKKKELLELVKSNEKKEFTDNLYSETHFIFQNIKWEHINVENIIQKTYYYMNYKYPFGKFLKKIKQVISFPPFSPIYSYPFILHHFNYERKKEELKNESLQKSICKFYSHNKDADKDWESKAENFDRKSYLKEMRLQHDSKNCVNFIDNEQRQRALFVGDDAEGAVGENKQMESKRSRRDENKKANNKYVTWKKDSLDQFDEGSEFFEKYVESILNRKTNHQMSTDSCRDDLKSSPIFKSGEAEVGTENTTENKNIYLHYPYSILCSNNIDANNQIVKKHLLVENFFIYVCYDFIINYEYICNKEETKVEKRYYVIQYININDSKRRLLKRIKEKKRAKLINRLKRHITYMGCGNRRKIEKYKEDPIVKSSNCEKRNKKKRKQWKLCKGKIQGKKNIGIIPPIYKYIVENSDMNKNILSYKKITLSNVSNIEENRKQKKTIKEFNFLFVTRIFYNYICNNLILFFFCISIITSFLYLKS